MQFNFSETVIDAEAIATEIEEIPGGTETGDGREAPEETETETETVRGTVCLTEKEMDGRDRHGKSMIEIKETMVETETALLILTTGYDCSCC